MSQSRTPLLQQKNKSRKLFRVAGIVGFTIIELTVVIAVIAVLATVAVVGYSGWKTNIASTQVKSDLSNAAAAMQSEVAFNDVYPSSIPGFSSSDGITVTLTEQSDSSFCIDGVVDADPTITFYINDSFAASGDAQEGTCADNVDLPVPNAPTNLVASNFYTDSLNLSWGSVTGAISYKAQCADDAAFTYNVQESNPSSASTTVSNVSIGTIYCRARAVSPGGNSDWSSLITASSSTRSGLVGWWRLNGNAQDSSGNGNHGGVNGATLTTGENGNSNGAYSFDGVDDYIEIEPTLTDFSEFSISIWAKVVEGPSAVSGIGTIMHRGASTNNTSSVYFLVIAVDDNYRVGFDGSSAAGATSIAGSTSTWRHIVLASNLTSGNQVVYVDGVQEATFTDTVQDNSTVGNRVGIGGNPHDPDYRPILGDIDDIRIYDHTLSSDEVDALFQSGAE